MSKEKDNLIMELVEDYKNYLAVFDLYEIQKIIKSKCFSLREIDLEQVDPR
jgi:hypothetical protein